MLPPDLKLSVTYDFASEGRRCPGCNCRTSALFSGLKPPLIASNGISGVAVGLLAPDVDFSEHSFGDSANDDWQRCETPPKAR